MLRTLWVRRSLRFLIPPACVLSLQLVLYPAPLGIVLQGVVVGLLGALVAVGMALIYRSNRILNFAQVELGLAPSVLCVYLITFSAMNYVLAVAIGLVGSVLVGAIIELAIVRRFFRAPRLILTVATIGLSQLLVAVSYFIPTIWNQPLLPISIHVPLTWSFTVNPLVFSADYVVALIVAPVALLAVALMLRYSNLGVAVRASAERADRAAMLGVPVKRLETIVWIVASVLSFIGVLLQAQILGVPPAPNFNYTVLLAALAAMVLGNMEHLPTIAMSAVVIGVLQQSVIWDQSNPYLPDAVIAGVVVATLVVRRVATSRLVFGAISSWSASELVRPIPRELRQLWEVRTARIILALLSIGAAIWLPWLVSGNAGNQLKLTGIVVFT